MPSGLEVCHPEKEGNTTIPALNISADFERARGELSIYLAVPKKQPGGRNVVEGGNDPTSVKHVYRLARAENLVDEYTGGNPQTVEIQRINAWLTTQMNDTHNMEYLRILRVEPYLAEGERQVRPREKEEYIPPVAVFGASPVMCEQVQTLRASLAESRRTLLDEISRFDPAVPVVPKAMFAMHRLAHVNAALGTLSTLAEAQCVPPVALYCRLRELLGALSAPLSFANKEGSDPFECPEYDHMEPGRWVFPLFAKFNKKLLVGDLTARYLSVQFMPQRQNRFQAVLTAEHKTKGKDFYVGVKHNQDVERWAAAMTSNTTVKFVPESDVANPFAGVTLRRAERRPPDFPSEVGLEYFRVDKEKDEPRWRKIVNEPTGKVYILIPPAESQLLEASFHLYMTL
jgi:type VI secretion system protein ImpJ